MNIGQRTYNNKQALEKAIKTLFARITYAPTFASGSLLTTTPVVLTKVAASSLINGYTLALTVNAAAANPTDTLLATFGGTAAATTLEITTNDGTNNPTTQADGTIGTTTPIVLTEVTLLGVLGNGKTLSLVVNAAAANPGATLLVDVTGNANAIVINITPNDGTNNAATPVDLTTAELVELINSGTVVGKTVTVTDVGTLLNNQTAAGGDATPLANGGEGDGEVALFANGANTAVGLTTAELVELFNTGAVVGKNVTVTDVGALRNDQTAAGGDATLLVAGGEGDGLTATFEGAEDFTYDNKYGFESFTLTAAGTIRAYLEDRYVYLRAIHGMIIDATARDFTVQVKADQVSASTPYIDLYTLTGGVATTLPTNTKLMIEASFKNTTVI